MALCRGLNRTPVRASLGRSYYVRLEGEPMNLQRAVRVVSSLFLIFSFGVVSNAQRDRDRDRGGRWEYLGQAHVDRRVDHDTIRVNRGGFREILFEIRGGAIIFQRVV